MSSFVYVSVFSVICFIVVGYFISRIMKRNDIADGMWGLGFLFVALLSYLQNSEFHLRKVVLLGLVVVWAIRLSVYLWKRLIRKGIEDARYDNWRKGWGHEPLMAFLQVFLLQGMILGVVSLPLSWVMLQDQTPIHYFDFLGLSLFLIGFLFEAIGDVQLANFKKYQPKKIFQEGLWGYTRHPNYFGEVLIWWGFFCFALSLRNSWWLVISPLLITYLLLRVSGVTMLENLLKKREGFASYQKSIPTFFPFSFKVILVFSSVVISLVFLDAIWLSGLMKAFYLSELQSVALTDGVHWFPVTWAVVAVYFFIALGVYYFAIRGSESCGMALFHGAMFGLVSYSIYEYTNIALVKSWSVNAALVDILWGTFLCGVSASIGKKISKITYQSSCDNKS